MKYSGNCVFLGLQHSNVRRVDVKRVQYSTDQIESGVSLGHERGINTDLYPEK